jgi:hydrogenase expression/formation protein HypC
LCLAVPAKVLKVEGETAEVDIGGIKREASLSLVANQRISVGDYVLLHTGYAIAKVDEAEAKTILKTWRDVIAAEGEAGL